MKKLVFLLSLFIFANLSFGQVKPVKIQKPTKEDVRKFLNKTNAIIKETAKQVKEHQVYTGAVKKAVEFQKDAIKNFKANKIKIALNLSAKARDFCMYAYVKNTGNDVPRDWRPGPKFKNAINKKYTFEEVEKELSEDAKNDEPNQLDNIDLEDLSDNSKGKQQTDTNSKGKTQK